MADSQYPFGTISIGQGDQVTACNALLDACSPAALYGRNNASSTGLTWGFHGGHPTLSSGSIATIASATVALTASSTNYVVALKSSGAVSVSTANTNWNNTTDYWRLYIVTTNTTGPVPTTGIVDYREIGKMTGSASGTGSSITAKDEGSSLTTALASIDFVGAGVTATTSGDNVTVTIPGGGGASDLFNVVDYGATGDGTTDDTTAVQDAIDAAAAAGGGVVYFPSGIYNSAGGLQDTSRSNAQLLLPIVNVSAEQITIELRGEVPPPSAASVIGSIGLPDNHSVIKGTLNTGSGTAPCMIGTWGPSGSFDDFSLVHVVLRNLTFRMPSNPVLTAVDLSHATCAELDNVIVDTGSYDVGGLSQMTTATSYGLRLPKLSNGALTALGIVNVIGFYNGIQVGEHTHGQNVNVWGCRYGVEFLAGYHPSLFDRLGTYHCQRGLVGTGGAHYLEISQLNIEHASTGTWVTTYDIDDASNYLKGSCKWHVVLAGTGHDDTFTTNGAGCFRCERLGKWFVYVLTDGATINVPARLSDSFRVTLGGNRTLANPTGLYDGQVFNVRIIQDGTGSRTLAYGSKYKFPGGAPTLSTAAGAKDFLSCQYDTADDTLFCSLIKAMS